MKPAPHVMRLKKTLLAGFFFWNTCAFSPASGSSLSLPRTTPEAQGVSSAALLGFLAAADQQVNEMNSFMLVRHGAVVAEGWWTPYSADTPHVLYSLSKSFTSTAVGLAISENKLSLDDEVLKFFPEDAPVDASNNLKNMRVRDLLCMSTGHQTEPRLNLQDSVPWTKTFLAAAVQHKPGTHFLYNTAGTYMQSAIVQKATGMKVFDFLRPRLFEPLGIENASWGTSPQGINLGGYGLNVRTEDIAKFGQLYLQKGQWQGKQLIPQSWVEAATARQTSNGSNPKSDWDQGYGYQFWRCRHGAYRGDGAFGQFCIVMPEQDAVVAITSGTRDMQLVLNLVWDKLLPALHSSALPEDLNAQHNLQDTLAKLSLHHPEGSASSSGLAPVSGRKYKFPANDQRLEAVSIESGESEGVTVLIRVNGVEYRLPCTHGRWTNSRMALGSLQEQKVAASAAWSAKDTLALKLAFYEGPTSLTAQLKFHGDELLWNAEYNVAFGPAKQPELIAKME